MRLYVSPLIQQAFRTHCEETKGYKNSAPPELLASIHTVYEQTGKSLILKALRKTGHRVTDFIDTYAEAHRCFLTNCSGCKRHLRLQIVNGHWSLCYHDSNKPILDFYVHFDSSFEDVEPGWYVQVDDVFSAPSKKPGLEHYCKLLQNFY